MFDLHKKAIISFLDKYLQEKENSFPSTFKWNKTIHGDFFDFLKKGKMLRGGLVLQSYLLFKNNISEDAIKVASAIELIHSSLLIHDDIMDNEEFRRGEKTISKSFKDFAEKKDYSNSMHFGNSMALSLGDLGFFLGFELLSSQSKPNPKIMQFVSQEISKVALAQMQDVYAGYTKEEFSEEEILSIYKYKTGRYSLSLPLALGAILADQSSLILKTLENLGEQMGILFQIKDDELNLFGTEKETGKSVGSDIKEDKKTLSRLYLFKIISGKEKEKLKNIFGNQSLNNFQIEFVRKLIKDSGVLDNIKDISSKLEQKAKSYIKDLELQKNQERALLEFLEYNLKRKK